MTRVCAHNRQPGNCRLCSGHYLCSHNRQRVTCRLCGGSGLCPHKRRRGYCSLCGGGKQCPHNRRRDHCVDCRGVSVCVHLKRKAYCHDCGGSGCCEHGKRKQQCHMCCDLEMCVHGRERRACAQCGEFTCDVEDCPLAGHRFCQIPKLLAHMRQAHRDDPKTRTKCKELQVYKGLKAAGVQFKYDVASERICLDFVIEKSWGLVVIAIDEDEHANCDVSYDLERDADIAKHVTPGYKVCVVHYNPGSFYIGRKRFVVPLYRRLAKLVEILGHLDTVPTKQLTRLFLYYTRDSRDAELPAVSKHWPLPMSEMSFAIP